MSTQPPAGHGVVSTRASNGHGVVSTRPPAGEGAVSRPSDGPVVSTRPTGEES